MLDLVIRRGLVVTAQDAAPGDVGILDGKIVAVASPGSLPGDAARVIDAEGKIVRPGGIEPHAHIAIPVPQYWGGRPELLSQPPEAATRAAAFGGVTTVVDFAGDLILEPGTRPPDWSILESLDSRRAVFRDHAYTDFAFHYILAGKVAPTRIGQLAEAIQEGVASFKIFTTFNELRVPYGHLWAVFAEVAKHGGIMAEHAEDRDALIAGLLGGDLCTTATDDFTVHKDVKLWGNTIQTVCGGHNGIETRLPVAFTKFVVERHMLLPRFAAITSTNAARILGLYPQKGVIAPGSDADLVLIDPRVTKTLALADLHSAADYSIWEGFTCRGYPVTTILRGKVIVESAELAGSPSDGRWVKRKVGADVLARPAV